MKKSKKVLIVILSILVVVFSLTTYILSLARLGVLCPGVYSGLMPKLHAYDSLYEGFTSYLLSPLETMEIPDELVGVPEDLVKTAITEKEFNDMVGDSIGGGLGWLLYNHKDVELPLKYFADSLRTTIENDERVINSETNVLATMEAIVEYRIEALIPTEEFEQTYRGYLYYYFAGANEQFRDTYDYWVDVFFYYYGIRLSIGALASFILLIVLMAVLLLISKGNRQPPLKLGKVLCIVYGTINVLIGAVLFALPLAAKSIGALASYKQYIEYLKGIINSFATLAVIYALVLFIAAVVLGTIQNNLKPAESN